MLSLGWELYFSFQEEEEEGGRDGGFMNNASHHWRNKDKINPPPHKHRALFLINFTFII